MDVKFSDKEYLKQNRKEASLLKKKKKMYGN